MAAYGTQPDMVGQSRAAIKPSNINGRTRRTTPDNSCQSINDTIRTTRTHPYRDVRMSGRPASGSSLQLAERRWEGVRVPRAQS
jgi:hypothetical protein